MVHVCREIVMRAPLGTQHHEGTPLIALAVSEQVEARLPLPFWTRAAVEQTVEKLGERLGCCRLEGEHAVRIERAKVQISIPHA